jgi:hypothetical protein
MQMVVSHNVTPAHRLRARRVALNPHHLLALLANNVTGTEPSTHSVLQLLLVGVMKITKAVLLRAPAQRNPRLTELWELIHPVAHP